jgi:hypothetical protein
MKTYVDQTGAPVILVRGEGTNELTLTQQRFYGSPEARRRRRRPRSSGRFPCCISRQGQEPRCELMKEPTLRIPDRRRDRRSSTPRVRGYYFSEYGPTRCCQLGKNAGALKAPERVTLVGDEWRMIRAGRHDVGTYLDLAGVMAADDTPSVIDELATRVGAVPPPWPTKPAGSLQGVDPRALRPRARVARLPRQGERCGRHPGAPRHVADAARRHGGRYRRPAAGAHAGAPLSRRPRGRCRRTSWARCSAPLPRAATRRCTTATWPRSPRTSRTPRSTTGSSTRSPGSAIPPS